MADPNPQQPMTFDAAPVQQPMTFDAAPTQQPMTFDAAPVPQPTPTTHPSLLQRGVNLVSKIPLVQVGIGAVKSAEEGLGGAVQVGTQGSQQREQSRASSLGVENQVTPPPSTPDKADQTGQLIADWLKKNTQREGFLQKSGAAAEIMGELFAGGEATSAASLPDKLMEVGRTLKAIENTPALQRLVTRAVSSGGRAAAETGTQAYVRSGGDPEAAASAAAMGGAIGGAGGVISEGLNALRPSTESIEGVDVPIAAAQRVGAPIISKVSGTPSAIADAQQAAAPQIIQNVARRAAGNVLNEVNATRGAMQGPAEEAGIQPGTFKFTVAPHGEPVETTDPNFVQKLLNEAKDVAGSDGFDEMGPRQQERVNSTVSDLQSQLDQYHQDRASRPHFTPVDVQSAIENTDDLGTAGDHMQNSVDDIYQRMRGAAKEQLNIPRLNSLTPDQFNQLMEDNADQFSPQERQIATDTFRKGAALKELHEAFQGGFNITPETASDTADLAGNQRRFSGSDTIGNNIDDVLKNRAADLNDMLGADGIRSIRRMNALLKNPDTAGPLQKILSATGATLRHHFGGLYGLVGLGGSAAMGGAAAHVLGAPPLAGATAGAATGYVLKKVIDKVATNPAIADRVAYAVEHNVAPRVASPLIAHMMIRSDQNK